MDILWDLSLGEWVDGGGSPGEEQARSKVRSGWV